MFPSLTLSQSTLFPLSKVRFSEPNTSEVQKKIKEFRKIDQINVVARKVFKQLPKNMKTLLQQNGLETGHSTKEKEAVALAKRFITLLSDIEDCLDHSWWVVHNDDNTDTFNFNHLELNGMCDKLDDIKHQFETTRVHFDGNTYLDRHLGPIFQEPSTSLCGRISEYFYGQPQASRISLDSPFSDYISRFRNLSDLPPISEEWADPSFHPTSSGFSKTVENWIKAKLQPSSQGSSSSSSSSSAPDSITGTDNKEE